MAPREARCAVCTLVASPEDVTIRLYEQDTLEHLPTDAAIMYLRRVGLEGTARQLKAKVLRHRHHVDQFLAGPGHVAPAQIVEGLTRIERPPPASWLDSNQEGINMGMAALGLLAAQLPRLDSKDLIAVAKLGQTATIARATLESKGEIKRAERIAALASGFAGSSE
jgi:hypothetical protein